MADQSEIQHVSIDEMLVVVGPYGRFQKLITVIFSIMTLPAYYHVMIPYFVADHPNWKCVGNSSTCNYSGVFESSDYRRCDMEHFEWKYTKPRAYSIVTYYDVKCTEEWMIELGTTLFFVGWILGVFILGWLCDVYGRKPILLISMSVGMTVGFITAFMPSLQSFNVCRFFVGFFLPGCVIQMFVLINEIVGNEYRAFAGLVLMTFDVISCAVLGLKAYFIREWKILYIACTAPYIFIIVLYKYIPESFRFLRVKGKDEEVMTSFQLIAKWNRKEIPKNMYITPLHVSSQTTNPLKLFKTCKSSSMTLVQMFGYFTAGLVYFSLYLAAGELGGYMYRDYTILTLSGIPISLVSIYFCNRVGRKRTTLTTMLIASVSCGVLTIIPKNKEFKVLRIICGMIGKVAVGSTFNTISTWSSELVPTYIRGAATAWYQVCGQLGGATAPWWNTEFEKLHYSASFIAMAIVSFLSFSLLLSLPETKGVNIVDGD